MDEFSQAYRKQAGSRREAARRLKAVLKTVIATIEDKALVRAELRPIRIKGLASFERKARAKGWQPDEALHACSDLIGARVVCNNVEDVYRFEELLRERLPIASDAFERQDYIKTPNPGGYRALHINFRIDAGKHPFRPELVPCEVQIRSRLQDAWAELSHDDVYKQPDLPADLRARAKDMAEVLAATDKIASEIRARVMQETVPPELRPSLEKVSADGLAYVFKNVFGRSPPDYVVRQALNVSRDLGITSLEGLADILARSDFRSKLEEAYRSVIPGSMEAEGVFLASLHALAKGDTKAVALVRRDARRAWREIEEVGRREALSVLPATFEEFSKQLDKQEADFEGAAAALETTNECGICGTTIIDPYAVAEAIVQHYGLSGDEADEAHNRIEAAVLGSGVETGGWGDGSFCAYHNEQVAKND